MQKMLMLKKYQEKMGDNFKQESVFTFINIKIHRFSFAFSAALIIFKKGIFYYQIKIGIFVHCKIGLFIRFTQNVLKLLIIS